MSVDRDTPFSHKNHQPHAEVTFLEKWAKIKFPECLARMCILRELIQYLERNISSTLSQVGLVTNVPPIPIDINPGLGLIYVVLIKTVQDRSINIYH